MVRVNVLDATGHLPDLVARAEAGEELIIERDGVPVAKLVPMPSPPAPQRPRVPGAWKGRYNLPDNWEEIWVEADRDVLEMFEESLTQDNE